MTKDEYSCHLSDCKREEIKGIVYIIKNDNTLLEDEKEELLDEASECEHEYNIAKHEAEQESYMYGDPTDDELGLTQM